MRSNWKKTKSSGQSERRLSLPRRSRRGEDGGLIECTDTCFIMVHSTVGYVPVPYSLLTHSVSSWTMIHPTSFVIVFLLIIDSWYSTCQSESYTATHILARTWCHMSTLVIPTQSIHTFILPLQDHWEGCILHTRIVFIPSYPLLLIVYYFAVYKVHTNGSSTTNRYLLPKKSGLSGELVYSYSLSHSINSSTTSSTSLYWDNPCIRL